jgi:hypothetical protein
MRRNREFLVILALLVIGGTSTAFGVLYTEVGTSPEPGHATILKDIYDGTFTGSGTDLGNGLWTVFSNGTVSALRVYDIDGPDEKIHIFTGSQLNIDQIWTDGIAHVTAQAKHASYTQSFGWNGGGLEPDNYIELLTHDDVTSGKVVPITILGDFLWGTKPNGNNIKWWSKNSTNGDTLDHLVTYKIEGLPTNWTVWLLFWEDLGGNYPDSDRDFNDFVIEVRAAPEPASILLLGLGALALLRKRRV